MSSEVFQDISEFFYSINISHFIFKTIRICSNPFPERIIICCLIFSLVYTSCEMGEFSTSGIKNSSFLTFSSNWHLSENHNQMSHICDNSYMDETGRIQDARPVDSGSSKEQD